jgi:hypothetical protein
VNDRRLESDQIPTFDALPHPIPIRVDDRDLDFESAKALAKEHALVDYEEVMLLAWFDKKGQRYSPNIRHCVHKKPSWVVYAESRGGNISIDINEEEYVFIFQGKERE